MERSHFYIVSYAIKSYAVKELKLEDARVKHLSIVTGII